VYVRVRRFLVHFVEQRSIFKRKAVEPDPSSEWLNPFTRSTTAANLPLPR
jgi:hypothetical protein